MLETLLKKIIILSTFFPPSYLLPDNHPGISTITKSMRPEPKQHHEYVHVGNTLEK